MEPNSRRDFIQSALAGVVAGLAAPSLLRAAETPGSATAAELPKGWLGSETVAMLIYPGFTALDLFGPHHFFISMMGAKVLLVAKDDEPVATDSKIKIHPTATFANCPEKLTVLFVPGGTSGTLAAARDEATRRFLADRGGKADWVTSVCTGSFLLGASGLLRGFKATSHWLAREELAAFGAIPVDQRVVVDRNRMTGAGVTSGLDFALQLVKDLRGEDYAKAAQLFSEYDPHPPLNAGSPAKCPESLVTLLRTTHQSFNGELRQLGQDLGFPKQ